MKLDRAVLKNLGIFAVGAVGLIAGDDAAFARDAFVGPRVELRGTWSELLANNYNAGYCYAYVGSNQCVSYPSKKLSSEGAVGGEVGYDAPLSTNATIGVYGRYDFGSGSNQDGNLAYKSKGNFAIGAKSNIYFKLGYQNWTVDTLNPNIGFDSNNVLFVGAPFVSTSHLSGVDIAAGADVLVTKKVYFGGEIGGGVLGGDSSVSGLNTGLKSLRVAVKIGTHF
eukprot:gene19412-19830_t